MAHVEDEIMIAAWTRVGGSGIGVPNLRPPESRLC